MSESWDRLTTYSSRHHGVIGLSVARQLAISKDQLHEFERAGRLTRPAPETYVVAGSHRTWHQRAMIATTSSAAWASHRTAAALWTLDGFPRRQIEILTPYGRKRDRADWGVHETRRMSGVDLAEVEGIPCTAVARTILDLAGVVHPFQVGQALDDACRRWPGMLDTVVQRFLEIAGRGVKGTRLLRAMLDERLGRGRFAQSGFESSALRLVRSVGLPDPVLQHMVRDHGFTAYLDLAWPAILWGVECDSLAWHSGKRAHEWDRRRRRKLKALGWDLVEVTYDDVTTRRHATGAQLRELYELRLQELSVTAQQR